jgi:hypothetical protein
MIFLIYSPFHIKYSNLHIKIWTYHMNKDISRVVYQKL